MNNTTNSPCINNCCLDAQDICLGCYRHIDEICQWRELDATQQREVYKKIQQRKSQLNKDFTLVKKI